MEGRKERGAVAETEEGLHCAKCERCLKRRPTELLLRKWINAVILHCVLYKRKPTKVRRPTAFCSRWVHTLLFQEFVNDCHQCLALDAFDNMYRPNDSRTIIPELQYVVSSHAAIIPRCMKRFFFFLSLFGQIRNIFHFCAHLWELDRISWCLHLIDPTI